MGGLGSGNRQQWSGKATVASYNALDVRRWAREGFLELGRHFSWQWSLNGEKLGSIQVEAHNGHLILDYRSKSYGDDWIERRYPVQLTTTPCHMGGERQWFQCPARGCGRRVAKLFGGAIFACRRCHNLAYPSQRETYTDRAARRADSIRERLGWPSGILNGSDWGRPKGMHHRTYLRLMKEHDYFADQSIQTMMAMFTKYTGKTEFDQML